MTTCPTTYLSQSHLPDIILTCQYHSGKHLAQKLIYNKRMPLQICPTTMAGTTSIDCRGPISFLGTSRATLLLAQFLLSFKHYFNFMNNSQSKQLPYLARSYLMCVYNLSYRHIDNRFSDHSNVHILVNVELHLWFLYVTGCQTILPGNKHTKMTTTSQADTRLDTPTH